MESVVVTGNAQQSSCNRAPKQSTCSTSGMRFIDAQPHLQQINSRAGRRTLATKQLCPTLANSVDTAAMIPGWSFWRTSTTSPCGSQEGVHGSGSQLSRVCHSSRPAHSRTQRDAVCTLTGCPTTCTRVVFAPQQPGRRQRRRCG